MVSSKRTSGPARGRVISVSLLWVVYITLGVEQSCRFRHPVLYSPGHTVRARMFLSSCSECTSPKPRWETINHPDSENLGTGNFLGVPEPSLSAITSRILGTEERSHSASSTTLYVRSEFIRVHMTMYITQSRHIQNITRKFRCEPMPMWNGAVLCMKTSRSEERGGGMGCANRECGKEVGI